MYLYDVPIMCVYYRVYIYVCCMWTCMHTCTTSWPYSLDFRVGCTSYYIQYNWVPCSSVWSRMYCNNGLSSSWHIHFHDSTVTASATSVSSSSWTVVVLQCPSHDHGRPTLSQTRTPNHGQSLRHGPRNLKFDSQVVFSSSSTNITGWQWHQLGLKL